MAQDNPKQLAVDTWQRVCFHIDGMAIATSVCTLEQAGVFTRLTGKGTDIADLAGACGLRAGYLNLVFRLLELQGYVDRTGDIAGGHASVTLTDAGEHWCAYLPAYRDAPDRIARARALLAGQDPGDSGLRPHVDELSHRVRCHAEGAEVAAAMTALARDGSIEQMTSAGDTGLELSSPFAVAAAGVLAAQGWLAIGDGRAALTAAGHMAVQMAPQYLYPMSYLATLASVPDLLTGADSAVQSRTDDGTEGHVDRELDIEFSGLVFARTCRDPLFELVLPLFDGPPLDDQPRAIVDCGAGDGTLLCELHDAIMQRTPRGEAHDTHPLVMIGVEYNPVAKRVLAERLAGADIPNLVFAGDIGEPEAIVERLAAAGYDPDDLLHVSKSVFHNRAYAGTPAGAGASSAGAFVAPGGEMLAAGRVEADLTALFARWRQCLGRHGMVVVEAHIADAELAALRLGRTVTTWLEASHGYSHQYLVEAAVHRDAASDAGLRVRGKREFGIEIAGAPMMTIDHYDA